MSLPRPQDRMMTSARKRIQPDVHMWVIATADVPPIRIKRGFHPTQRMQRKERNEMTSLLDRPITAASDDGVCRWHAAQLRQKRHKIRNYRN